MVNEKKADIVAGYRGYMPAEIMEKLNIENNSITYNLFRAAIRISALGYNVMIQHTNNGRILWVDEKSKSFKQS